MGKAALTLFGIILAAILIGLLCAVFTHPLGDIEPG
jgi:hypothetical protein